MYVCVVIFLLFCLNFSQSFADDFSCNQLGPCTCLRKNGEMLDLSPLLPSDSRPLIASTTTYMFIYHPCFNVPLNSKEKNVCQLNYGICYFKPHNVTGEILDFNKVISNTTFGSFRKVALNEEAIFQVNELHVTEIIYKHADENDLVTTTTVQLQCDEKIKDYTLSVDVNLETSIVFTLSSHYLCLGIPYHISKGAVFFLILVILIAVYFVGGILILKFLRGATGIEMIPNHEFWCSLPEKIKNGFTYLLSFGKKTPDSYEKI